MSPPAPAPVPVMRQYTEDYVGSRPNGRHAIRALYRPTEFASERRRTEGIARRARGAVTLVCEFPPDDRQRRPGSGWPAFGR